jgi:hypothetical protein
MYRILLCSLAALILLACNKRDHVIDLPKASTALIEDDTAGIDLTTPLRLGAEMPSPQVSLIEQLQFRPSGRNVVLLDFDGYLVSGTNWNFNGDFYADPSGLTTWQKQIVVTQFLWAYRGYDILFTLDDGVYDAADPMRRMRVVFTANSAWYGPAGGVAYMRSFTWGNNTPCFVFTRLLQYNTKLNYAVGIHELGHTLGLRHQASGYFDSTGLWIKTSEYDRGTPERCKWMGVAYYSDAGYFGIGYNSYGRLQDDHLIMEAVLGPRRRFTTTLTTGG